MCFDPHGRSLPACEQSLDHWIFHFGRQLRLEPIKFSSYARKIAFNSLEDIEIFFGNQNNRCDEIKPKSAPVKRLNTAYEKAESTLVPFDPGGCGID